MLTLFDYITRLCAAAERACCELRATALAPLYVMKSLFSLSLAGVCLLFLPAVQSQGFLERFGFGGAKTAAAPLASLTGLSQEEMINGLRAALAKGVEHAVGRLGTNNGFLQDLAVKIPMPEELHRVEKTLRRLGQDRLADEFIITLNRAAEQAVPQAASVLADSVKQMSLADAEKILTGTNNAATEYFRQSSSTNLYTRFYPIVQQATAKTGLTGVYKKMIDQVPPVFGSFLGTDATDLDGYVTRRSLDGLFLKIADEEKHIRENPLARTTDLLQKVFGAVKR